MCGITISSRHIYNRISYTRTRAERRAAKENACACVHIRKRTYVAAARRQAGRKAFRRLKGYRSAAGFRFSPRAEGRRARSGRRPRNFFNSFMIGFALPVTYRLFSLPVIFICRPQRFCRKKKQSASSAFGHAVLMRKLFRVSAAFTRSDCTARLLPARSARAGSSPCRRLSAPLSP